MSGLLEQADRELAQGSVSDATLAQLIEVYISTDRIYAEVHKLSEDALITARESLGAAVPNAQRATRRCVLEGLVRDNSALINQALAEYREARSRGEHVPKLMHDIVGAQQRVKAWREELLDFNGAELLEIRHNSTLGGSTH
ncbi:hypothetical protein [Halorhodospira abdelmalekii]|uniref:hypothetical protein n=1 Tax=Halorhodospira abdelmalekii TaxID=421629 RepID=UPI00190664A5|nr:hypothetical protein [Halorhodospira abdelmalekii]